MYNCSMTRPVIQTQTESVLTAPGSWESKSSVELVHRQGLDELDRLMVTPRKERVS